MDGYWNIVLIFINLISSSKGTVTVTDPSERNAVTYQGTLSLLCKVTQLDILVNWDTPAAGTGAVCLCVYTDGRCYPGSTPDPRASCTINTSQKVFTLTITNINISDEGRYRCRQTETEQASLNISVQGNVKGPYGKNAVTDQGTLTLKCKVTPLDLSVFWHTPAACLGAVCFCTNTDGNCYQGSTPDPRASCTINTSQELFTLTIINMNISVDSIYRCRQTATKYTSLTISVQVSITNVNVTSPATSTVTVVENSTSTFVCETSAGRPHATITWYKQLGTNAAVPLQGDIITTTPSGTLVVTRSALQFTPTRIDHNYKLYCTAYNIDASSTKTSTNKPQLYVQYAPDSGPAIKGHTSGSTFYILDGKPQSLTCSIEGGRPLASLSWSCFSGAVQDQSTGATTQLHVTWTAARAHDGQLCICLASHPVWTSTRQVYETIEALYPPNSPTFTVQSQQVSSTVSVIEDTSVSVICSSTSNPSPVYSWNPRGSSPSSDILTLTSVSTNISGSVYTCTVTNTMTPTQGAPESSSSSASITLDVLFPPRTPVLRYSTSHGPLISSVFNVVRGDSFSIYCKAECNPSPSYQWSVQSANNNKLTVTGIQTDTSWTCTATNAMVPTGATKQPGSSTATATANVLYGPSTPKLIYHNSSRGPVFLENGVLNVLQGKSFVVTCDGSDSKPPSSFTWSGPVTSTTGTLRVDNLQSRTSSSCTANNVMTRTFGAEVSKSSSQNMTIDVLYPPTLLHLTNATAVENVTFAKDCSVTPGNPDNTYIKWIRVNDNSVISNGPTLTIGQVSRGDAGTYMCTANNTMQPTGETAVDGIDSATFILTVYYSASITEFTINGAHGYGPFTYNENATVTIACVVDSNPRSEITISRDGSEMGKVTNRKDTTRLLA